ncbi:U-box domain-containing protein 33-like [Castanea sativa]|uniref:U-box domain-containing protein 33-like n=1 Tax=Castanea sativa TaxID=21020 RepID=UPI003F64D789
MESGHKNLEDLVASVTEETIYVAVGIDVKGCKSTLSWALHNNGGKRICIIHVHRPAQWIPSDLGGGYPASLVDEKIVGDYRKTQCQNMKETLEVYLSICRGEGVEARSVWIEMGDIGKGIVELISHDGIKELVMGGALDKHYKEKMSLKSKKAKYVCKQAPLSCCIQFICSGRLINTREPKHLILRSITRESDRDNIESRASSYRWSKSVHRRDITEAGPSNHLRSGPVTSICQELTVHMVKILECFQEEVKQRKEVEEALVKEREELEKLKNLEDQMLEELRIAKEQNTFLKSQNEELQKERDELQIEHDNALQEAEGLRSKQAEASIQMSEFLPSEIEEATQGFDDSLIIGRGGYGNVYKGFLRQNQVAIKSLRSNGSQGSSEFKMEVRALSQLTHPNLVKLIGCCLETFVLVYEYVPNGSLEDRLNCKNKSTPLSWQTRIHIVTELCSVLVYLHSRKPHSIVHGDLKPSNILLDANFKIKLSDFGICRILCHDIRSSNDTTLCHFTDPKGTLYYIDPEFYETGKLTRKSDVYSFGVILLQLLTGQRPPFNMENDVQVALDAGKLSSLLDPLAGDWPIKTAQELAHLALWCCDRYQRNRPDLSSEVRKVLEPIRAIRGFEETAGQ